MYRLAIPKVAGRITAGKPIAEWVFELQRLDDMVTSLFWAEIKKIVLPPPDVAGSVAVSDAPPWDDLTTDPYDSSIEFKGAADGFVLTVEQWVAIKALGFERCWICYENGSELYYAGGGRQSGGGDASNVR